MLLDEHLKKSGCCAANRDVKLLAFLDFQAPFDAGF